MNALKSLFTKYISHLTAYIVSAAGIVAVVSPKTLPPLGALAVGIAGLITTAASHGYTAGTGTQVAQAALDAATKALASVKPAALGLMFACIAAFPAFCSLSGCAQLTAFEASPTGSAVITSAAQVAVATAVAKGYSVAQINTIAKQALAADSGSAGTLAAVSGLVNTQLAALKLPAADLAAAEAVEIALSAVIQAKVGTNTTLATGQAAVADVLNAVIAASGG